MRGTAGCPRPARTGGVARSAVVGPIVNYLEALHAQSPEIILTCGPPRDTGDTWWHRLRRDHLGQRLRRAVEHHAGIAVTEVPFQLMR
jgi:hypothetical protein